MIRPAVVAGQFYPAQADQLQEMIRGMVDETAEQEEVIGLVLPHAGYIYSGPVAGATVSKARFKDTFIILGPNHTGLGKPLSIMTEGSWETPLGKVEIDAELAGRVLAASQHLEEDAEAHSREHSIEVQLPFLQYFKKDVKIVPICLARYSASVFKEIGGEIARAVKESGREVVILASSDMTHYESQQSAQRKDARAIAAILELNEDQLLDSIEELNISMCGYAPVVALISAAKELGVNRTDLVRYQTSGDVIGDYSSVVGYAGIILTRMSSVTSLAKETVETYVRQGEILSPPAELTREMKEKAGVFVSIHKLGALRGCIGTFEPQRENVAEEIITNAVSAATQDPRFPPVTLPELADLDYSVDILTRPEPIESKDELDPKKYGCLVECDFRRGLLLPDLEGVDTADYQVSVCCQKAGIAPGEPVKLYRFQVKRYK